MRFSVDVLDPEPVGLLESETPGLPPEAYLGLLLTHHTYSAEVPIPHSLGDAVNASTPPDNNHVTIMEVSSTSQQSDDNSSKYISTVKLQVKTTEDGSIAEKIKISSEGSAMEIMVTAKVLKSNQGNPVLRTGIHMLSHEQDSNSTEWPGTTCPKEE